MKFIGVPGVSAATAVFVLESLGWASRDGYFAGEERLKDRAYVDYCATIEQSIGVNDAELVPFEPKISNVFWSDFHRAG